MVEISRADKKEGKKLFFYDYVGIGLVIISLIFFIKVISFLAEQNYVAAIIGTVIGFLIFSAGMGMIKMSAIVKMSKEGIRKDEL